MSYTKKIINSSVSKTIEYLDKESEMEGKELSVLLTDDEFIQTLNKELRGKDKPTNVLSIPHMPYENSVMEGKDISAVLGEIIISHNTLVRESEEQSKSFDNHLTHLLVHSTLHLFGFDHMDEQDAENMEEIEIEILEDMGINNPYIQ